MEYKSNEQFLDEMAKKNKQQNSWQKVTIYCENGKSFIWHLFAVNVRTFAYKWFIFRHVCGIPLIIGSPLALMRFCISICFFLRNLHHFTINAPNACVLSAQRAFACLGKYTYHDGISNIKGNVSKCAMKKSDWICKCLVAASKIIQLTTVKWKKSKKSIFFGNLMIEFVRYGNMI